MKINDKAITAKLEKIRRAVGVPHKAITLVTRVEELVADSDGLPLSNPEDIKDVGGLLTVVDPATGKMHHVTVYIKSMPNLSEKQVRDHFHQERQGLGDRLIKTFRRRHETPRVIHLAVCRTILEMKKKGRFDHKYHASKKKSHERKILVKGNAEKELPLRVCKLCLGELGYVVNPSNLTDFGFSNFFEENASLFSVLPPLSEADPADDYTADWSAISRRYRQSKNWQCECCGVRLGDTGLKAQLHLHHINGVKSDNRSSNLRALCVLCHGAQHDRNLSKGEGQAKVRQARKQQEVATPCKSCGH